VQPAFLASEGAWLGKRLGSRVDRTYSLAKLKAAGVPLLGGSDCPVEPPNPWGGIAAAADLGGLDRAAALGLFGQPLTTGTEANFLLIDRDPSTTTDLAATKVTAVYRHGQPISLVDELPFS
jgi:predicted amidohydrolase YtcJ